MLDNGLKSNVNNLWDKFWSGGISDPLVAITQMSYLIFMKRLEDADIKREQNAKLNNEKFESIFEGNEDCKWSVWTEYPADKILEHVRDRVFPFLRELGGKDSLYALYMKDSIFGIPTPSLLIEAVKLIDEMEIKDQNRDTKGDIYEYLLSELKTAGKNGQFRTPRHIIEMIVNMVDPRFGDVICDPACGTAGFLIAAYEHILKEKTSKELLEKGGTKGDKLSPEEHKILRNEVLYGFDFDTTMTRISLMNLMMHGIDNPNINQVNTLSTRYNETNQYDVVLANPPFKGSVDESELNENFKIKAKKTEILFLELMYHLLHNGGRCGVIVPDGVIFGSTRAHKKIKQLLFEKCRLDAVVSMPSGVFRPYAGVSTGVLVFTKGEPTKEVWFYEMESDGFSLDDKRTFIDGKGDIPDILEKFKRRDKEKFDDRKAKCFFVPVEEIVENDYDLSISEYKEIVYEEIEYEKPEVIKKKILDSEKEIIKTLKDLEV